jgi:hypothetical protein
VVKPTELESPGSQPIWETIAASARGDVAALRALIERDPRLSRAEYWYTPAMHFAVREGHTEAVRLLLEAGADPAWNGLHDGSLAVMAAIAATTGSRSCWTRPASDVDGWSRCRSIIPFISPPTMGMWQ